MCILLHIVLDFKRIIMYRVLVFVVLTVAATSAGDPMAKCGRLFRPDTFDCCATSAIKPIKQAFEAELKECFDIPMNPFSCAREECIAKKKGYLASDGGIDKEEFGNLMEKDLTLDADKVALIKEKCLDGDIAMYGPPDMCDLMKLKHCLHTQLLKDCPEWSDREECSGLKELFDECSKNA